MMEIGIFARTFKRPTLEETLDAVAEYGFRHMQFNMQCAGLPPMPDSVDASTVQQIQKTCDKRGIVMSALSGTFNMAHPERVIREQGMRRLDVLASIAGELGAPLITLCTGTRDPVNMWRHHPENAGPTAWADLKSTMRDAIEIAERHDLLLGVEPEPGNVVSNAPKALSLLDEMESDRLGIILDPANIIEGISPDHIDAAIDEAFDLLGDRIVSVHGKDRDGAGKVVPAGRGVVPWSRFFDRLRQTPYEGPIIIHGLDERDVRAAKALLEQVITAG